jgi:glycosyltransferase involved in cell wall biosynthesis
VVRDEGVRRDAFTDDIKFITGIDPFIFARNANLGIAAAGKDDVILLNDDALLETPNGLDQLAEAAKGYDVMSTSVLGRVGNPNQYADGRKGIRVEEFILAFICVYIPRTTLDKIGGLDERFIGYGYDDNDYCWRVKINAGRLGVCGDVIVNHEYTKATFKHQENFTEIYEQNRQIYLSKWGKQETQSPIKLSLLVCSIKTRSHFLTALQANLQPQLTDEVELLVEVDDGEIPIGLKRNRLLHRATGTYIAYIDDDDKVSDTYVKQILAAIKNTPDCVGFKSQRYVDGVPGGTTIYSLRYNEWRTVVSMKGIVYERTPCHLNPVLREKALMVQFPCINFGEDRQYSMDLLPLLKTEEYIDDVLYYYYFRGADARQGEIVNKAG